MQISNTNMHYKYQEIQRYKLQNTTPLSSCLLESLIWFSISSCFLVFASIRSGLRLPSVSVFLWQLCFLVPPAWFCPASVWRLCNVTAVSGALPNIQHGMQRAHMTEGFQWVSQSGFWICISIFVCIFLALLQCFHCHLWDVFINAFLMSLILCWYWNADFGTHVYVTVFLEGVLLC